MTPRPSAPARWIFIFVSAALLAIFVRASFDFGVTWDEMSRHTDGEGVWQYLQGLRDRSSFEVAGEGRFYPGLFDTICAAIAQWVPANPYVLRHVINAIAGWIGLVYAGRLASRLFGTWTGVLTMVLLAASPRYFAHSMNNPKDLPFAAATVAALYYFSLMSPAWPYLSNATTVKIVLALAAALNIRAGALLYLGYFAMLLAVFVIAERQCAWRRLASTAARAAAMAVAVLLLGTVFWPWAQGAPLTRPFEAMIEFSNFPWDGLVLFNGRQYPAIDLPWTYAPKWLLISTPPVVIAGMILSMHVWRGAWNPAGMALWTVAALPVVLVVVRHSTLYDGIRHLLFVYPVFGILSAAGWAAWIGNRNRSSMWGPAALLLIGLIHILVFNVRYYPNQVVYFNEVVGGPRGAFARFEMDYWGNCALEAVAWSAHASQSTGRPLTISGWPEHIVRLDAERFPQLSFAPESEERHHLTIYLNRSTPYKMTELATRADALYRVHTADGAVLCVVMPGPAFDAKLRQLLPPAPAAYK